MLADNILYLKKNNPVLYNAMKKWEETNYENEFSIEETKSNHKTIKYQKDGTSLYLHSKYDPIREAEAIIDKFVQQEQIDEKTNVIFYGIGLGYHVEVFARRFPNTSFSLYEPSQTVFKYFLDNRKLKDFSTKNISMVECEYRNDIMSTLFEKILNNADRKTVVIELPFYKNVLKDQYSQFSDSFKRAVVNKRSEMNTNYAFQKRWIVNCAYNLKETLRTPNILMNEKSVFNDKVVVLVAAGPSLDYEIENLRLIKEKGLAFIFSVGSAINTLLHHNILPDAMCTYDPQGINEIVFKKVNDNNITSIPMIYGSSVGFEVLEQYKGPKYHMITSQDTLANYVLKDKRKKGFKIVNDAASIAVVTLELLIKLGFSHVILVGQNLAYQDERNYASGIDYHKNGISPTEEKKIITRDVLGNDVFTTYSFNMMREQIESVIEGCNSKVINTTVKGANIEGAPYMPLNLVINSILCNKIVQGDEFDEILNFDIYDREYLKNSINKMGTEFGECLSLINKIKRYILEITELLNNHNNKKVIVTYEKIDSLLSKIELNEFFKVVIIPMNRVEFEILANSIQRIVKEEKNDLKKYSLLIVQVEKIINLYQNDYELYKKIMNILEDNLK